MPSALDDYRLPNFAELHGPDRFDELEVVVRKADDEGVIDSLPASEAEVQDEQAIESRIRTIRTRLYLMGYLGRDNGSSKIGKRMRKAIRVFQEEARLEVDGWVGEQTWTALQELVSFETPSNIGRWCWDGGPSPPLRRALEIRLHVLGLLPSRHPKKVEKVLRALEEFALVVDLLDLTETPLKPEFSPETLAVLFDQDAMVARLAKGDESFSFTRPAHVPQQRAKRLVRSFVICSAKIELWLLGFDVNLDGRAAFSIPSSSSYRAREFPVFDALRQFWLENGQTGANARTRSSGVTGAFFLQLLEIQEKGDRVSDSAAVDRLYDTLTEGSEANQKSVWNQIKKIGSRIWDGIKRAWRWFKSLLKRGIRKLARWVKNLARVVYRSAVGAFRVVKRAIAAAAEAIPFMLKPEVPGSDRDHLAMSHDADFDYLLFLNRSADPEKVDELLTEFALQAYRFGLAIRILGALIGVLIKTMKGSVLTGWFGLLMSLAKIRGGRGVLKDLLALGRDLPAEA